MVGDVRRRMEQIVSGGCVATCQARYTRVSDGDDDGRWMDEWMVAQHAKTEQPQSEFRLRNNSKSRLCLSKCSTRGVCCHERLLFQSPFSPTAAAAAAAVSMLRAECAKAKNRTTLSFLAETHTCAQKSDASRTYAEWRLALPRILEATFLSLCWCSSRCARPKQILSTFLTVVP